MKRGRRKGGSKDKVFGCDLMEHLTATNQEIPLVLRNCSMFIEEHGIVDGIYRLSGVSSNTQKLRSEFDNEGSPDLYKDVYMQDIHCVSSLCKAYFRELPNPLLTYQLYDHFAEAVAVQLEDERLVRIKEVLKELPQPHFRTLEFLMKHLVRMATYSNQTNMHARNLAIVWAPNLLRSKDIEASGFNGTAAFMEVRVQSIVVEFILTHVAQLFPELDIPGSTTERRKSLPSPTLQEDNFFRSLLPVQYPGNMSPGDGPPLMRPYHAIIDGTDKRKGSLKGRKWKSIFNLGGRLHDPRKKKYTPKEKEKTTLRPAKSMDSLSSGPYTQQDSRHGSPQLSTLAISPASAESGHPGGRSSGYAVTYRRTGGASVSMVSGGNGAQGTYRSLDSGAGANVDKSQPSQGTTSRAERRAGMHITGPFSVTVPLHITSGLALGVLHGGRSEDEEVKPGQNEEGPPKNDKENDEEMEAELSEVSIQTDEKTESLNDNKESKMDSMSEEEVGKEDEGEGREPEEARHEEQEESGDKEQEDQYPIEEVESNETQQTATERPSLSEDNDGGDYMVMKGGIPCADRDRRFEESQEEEYPDHELPLDFQDTFGFLDLMDMPSSNQMNEFSVEPPAFEMEEYEEDDRLMSPLHPYTETSQFKLLTETSRPVSSKSHSLPYQSCPFQPVEFSSDEDGSYSGLSQDDNSSDLDKEEYEDMFFKSLPSESHFQGLNWTNPEIIISESDSNVDSLSKNQSECLTQTQDIQDSVPADIEIIPSNAVDECATEENLSPLQSETDHLNVEEKKNEDRSTEDGVEDESGLEELRDVSEPVQEENRNGTMESTDSKDETHSCSHKDSHSTDDEDQEDTYFGPDAPSTTVEPSNSDTDETSCTADVEEPEEPTSLDDQQETPDSYIDIETITDVSSPELQATQNKTETGDLLVKAEIVLHTTVQEQGDGNELEGVALSEEREVGEKGEEECGVREVEEKTIIKGESTESEHSEEEDDDEGNTYQTDDQVDKMGKDSDMVVEEEQTYVENKREEVGAEKQKEDSDEGLENDLEEDGVEEEIEVQKDCHLEGVSEQKEGSIPEEMSEEDDRLSEDGEEQQSEKEKESTREDKHEELSIDEREKPVRPPRMKERAGGRGSGLGLGVGRTVIITKHKMYQVKAVPVVPPKPQHSKITAFRQQFQQRDTERPITIQQKPVQPTCTKRQNTDRRRPRKEIEKETVDEAQNHDFQNAEQGKEMWIDSERPEENKAGQVKKQLKDTKSCNSSLEGEIEQDGEEQRQRSGTWDGGSFRKDGQKDVEREAKRTSCISMCFDEAVARATGKRYKEKECMEKDRAVDLHWEKNEQKEGLTQRMKEEEDGKTD